MISLMMEGTRTDRGGDFALYPPLPKGNVGPNIKELKLIEKLCQGQFVVFEMYDDTVMIRWQCSTYVQ